MPGYSSHLIINFLFLSGLYILYVQHPFLTTVQLAIFIFSFFVGTVVLTPDLDVKSEAAKRCGIVCVPYRKIFRHRKLSHHWLWGVVTRILYVLILLIVTGAVVWALKVQLPEMLWVLRYPFESFLLIAGLFIANLLHIISDMIA